MKNFLLSAVALAAISMSASAQTRMTLHEEFTGENCPPCASTNPGFWALCDGASNPSKLIHISYMVPIPSAGFYCNRTTAIYTARDAYYSVPFAPYGRYDGHVPNPTASSPGHPGYFTQADIDAEAAIPSHFNMTVTNAWNATYDSVTTSITVTCVTAYSGSLYLRTALIETNDFFTPPGTNGETHFANVVQAMYPNVTGTVMAGSWNPGDTHTYTLVGAVPSWVDKTGAPYIVSWIQNDADKYIDQAAQGTPLPGIALDVAANPSVGVNDLVCGGATFSTTHTATLKNTGTTTLTSVDIYYKATGGSYTSYPWTGSLAPGATTTVTMPAVSMTPAVKGSYQTITDSVANPNATVDINPANNVSGITFFVESTVGVPMPFRTSFEHFTDSLYYYTDAGSNNRTWGIWQTGTSGVYLGHSGTYAAGFPLKNYPAGTVNSIILQEVNVTSPASAVLTFWVSYSQQTSASSDVLEVVYSTDCGGSWNSLWSNSGAAMATLPAMLASAGFSYPTSPTQYDMYSVSLSSVPAGPLMFAFRMTDGGGNFICVDDITISVSTDVKTAAAISSDISIFPNPSKGEATLSFNLDNTSDVQVQVIDGLGRVVKTVANEKMNAGVHSLPVNTESLASGVYNVIIRTDGGVFTQHLSVVK